MQLKDFLTHLQRNYNINPRQTELKFSEAYTIIEAEMQKLSSLNNEKPDYLVILKHAVTLLEEGSNDLLFLSYLAFAMQEQYQWQGCLSAINFISKRLKEHWQTLTPEKPKSRVAALTWLLERYQNFFNKQALNKLSKEFLETLNQSLMDFNQELCEKFPQELNALALLKPIQEQLQRIEAELSSKAAKLKAEEEVARLQKETALAQELQKNSETISIEDYLAQINTQELHQLSSKRLLEERLELLTQQPLNFAIYKHNRSELWWHHPCSTQELFNQIDAQGLDWEQFSKALELKAKHQDHQALINFEKCFINYPYFLEIQKHIYDCLQNLGAEANLLSMLKQETQQLLEIYPELLEAKINAGFAVVTKTAKELLSQA